MAPERPEVARLGHCGARLNLGLVGIGCVVFSRLQALDLQIDLADGKACRLQAEVQV